MRNPLNKRLPRELKSDFGKYLVIFVLLIGMISLVSGFLVADESMLQAYDESFSKYQIEDGHFSVDEELSQRDIRRVEEKGVSIAKLYSKTQTSSNHTNVRLFAPRNKFNKVCVMSGRLPQSSNEIAVDRMFADNNHLTLGSPFKCGHKTYKITGLVALSDYSALFENNGDMMFDALKFGVGIVTDEEFTSFEDITYSYAFRYNTNVKDVIDEHEKSNRFLKELNKIVSIKEYIPRYENQAINYTGDDMGGDKGMMTILLYIMIAIIAFIFAVTISNTITNESRVIGTLMATGYTKQELLMHYMTLPTLVTFISAILGNILGYSFMKDIMAGLYYGSYSLPTYKTIWSSQAFIETTLVPIILMFIINFGILSRKFTLTPQDFLRKDLRKNKRKKAIRLQDRMPFLSRFRLRVFFQNIASYAVLLVGIMFANLLLLFGSGLPDVIDNYQMNLKKNMIATHQYILKIPNDAMNEEDPISSYINMSIFRYETATRNKDAESFMAYTLKTTGEDGSKIEDVMVYGIKDKGKYISIPHGEDTVVVSRCYAEKYHISKGDNIVLKEAYNSKAYNLTVTGINDYQGAVCVFMPLHSLNRMLSLDEDFTVGYFSHTKIADIDKKYINTTIDYDSLSKVSRQLDASMGSLMDMVYIMVLVMFMFIVYLLSKQIIEKNKNAISMTKILGYDNKEISKIYLVTTTLVTIFFLAASLPIVYILLKPLFEMMMRKEMTGWIIFDVSNIVFIKAFIFGVLTYSVVAVLEYYKISKVPLTLVLKDND